MYYSSYVSTFGLFILYFHYYNVIFYICLFYGCFFGGGYIYNKNRSKQLENVCYENEYMFSQLYYLSGFTDILTYRPFLYLIYIILHSQNHMLYIDILFIKHYKQNIFVHIFKSNVYIQVHVWHEAQDMYNRC